MSPRVSPRPGARYRVRVSEVVDGESTDFYDEEGDAYVVAVAKLEGTRIDALVDREGTDMLQRKLLEYITESVTNPLRPRSP
jgi:hypothetical protein